MARKSGTSSSNPRRGGLRPEHASAIADRSAKLIIEGGLTDWTFAKRKAAKQLGLDDTRGLPDDAEIIGALAVLQNVFHRDTHPKLLLDRRREALQMMQLLGRFHPVLTGGVADGWATSECEACLELTADSVKEVEFELLKSGVCYRALESSPSGDQADLGLVGRTGPLRLRIRQRLQVRHIRGAARLRLSDLAALLESAGPDLNASRS